MLTTENMCHGEVMCCPSVPGVAHSPSCNGIWFCIREGTPSSLQDLNVIKPD